MAKTLFPKGMQPVLERLRGRGQPLEERVDAKDSMGITGNSTFSVEDLFERGAVFVDDNSYPALEMAEDYATTSGVVATLPYLIAAKVTANEQLEQQRYSRPGIPIEDIRRKIVHDYITSISEEYIGMDTQGLYVARGNKVVVIIHGSGLLRRSRLMDERNKITLDFGVPIKIDAWNDLLQGKLPSGETIPLFSLDDVMDNRIPDPFGKYGVVLDYLLVKDLPENVTREDFVNNALVIARAGTPRYLGQLYDVKEKWSPEPRNSHALDTATGILAQGWHLTLNSLSGGLGYQLMDGSANKFRYVGVPPKKT